MSSFQKNLIIDYDVLFKENFIKKNGRIIVSFFLNSQILSTGPTTKNIHQVWDYMFRYLTCLVMSSVRRVDFKLRTMICVFFLTDLIPQVITSRGLSPSFPEIPADTEVGSITQMSGPARGG